MRIGIDANEANVENRVGSHQYAFEIFHALYDLVKESKSKDTFVLYLKEAPSKDLPKQTDWWQYKVLGGRKFWILTKLMPYLLKEKEVDVLFAPGHYLPVLSQVPMVCTIHDLGYLDSSEQFNKYDFWQLKLWTAKSISLAKSMIAVSQSTKDDIVRHYPAALKKTAVVHHGYDRARFHTKMSETDVRRIKKKFGIEGEYILFLSTLKPSKNIEGLVEGFAKLNELSDKKYTLVIAGKKGWLYETIFEKVKEVGCEDSVIFTGFVSEEDKPTLYYGASVFALPVFWEGFGMTALEAMACGTPVVTSKVGALPEVVGDAGFFVNPHDPKDIAQGLHKMLSMSKKEYTTYSKRAAKHAMSFSWEKAGKETLKVIKGAVNV